jgi:hypothetical protein
MIAVKIGYLSSGTGKEKEPMTLDDGKNPQLTPECASGDTERCYGFIDPLVHGSEVPCMHECHEEDNPRDFEAALRKASDQ